MSTEHEHVTTPEDLADPIQREHRILAFWDEHKCFDKLVAKNADGPVFRFVDGPITANNPMGVHHAWGRTLKDAFIRYKAMRGHTCHYRNGFDCQGLWVEVEVEKELGLEGKPDIVAYGIDNFSRKCRERVLRFSKVQTEQSIRLGQWMDWDNSYYTYDDSNILGIWNFLKVCHERGWLYRSGTPMPWCLRCGTSLSEHEMAGSYTEMQHRSVFVRAKLKERNASCLVWTTTPWTLAANVAIAVNPFLEYGEVEIEGEDQPLIFCLSAIKNLGDVKYKVLSTFKGEALLGLHYEPIVAGLPAQDEAPHVVVSWEAVDPTEGTGIVHMAPGCGAEDFEVAQRTGLPVLDPVDENGDYVKGYGWLEGKNVLPVAAEVIAHLEKHGKLFKEQLYTHSYPVCWRCKSELIFRYVEEWFIRCDEIRPRLIEASRAVQWQPEFLGKRMEDWLNNMGDWCISRKRFWGLPLPFYICDECGKMTVIGSLDELKEVAIGDVDVLPELHRPWIDDIRIRCPHCEGEAKRVVEVGDCWLDAGIVPYSTLGYFEDREKWHRYYPIEWICEMREQVRLWFYSMLFMGVTLSDRAPYERTLGYERVVSEDGQPFSKTGFMIRFDEAAERIGADAMRYLYSSQNPASELRFGFATGEEMQRRLLKLWNISTFFTTYARLDKPSFSDLKTIPPGLTITDRWLLARTYEYLRAVNEAMENYSTSKALQEYETFVEDVSNWYIRVNRRRFWKSGSSEDKYACYWTLYSALRVMVQTMAPIIPFLTEAVWQESIRPFSGDPVGELSVHLSDWPELDERWRDPDVLGHTVTVQAAINALLRLRNETQIRIRQPLGRCIVVGPEAALEAMAAMTELVASQVNVKNVETSAGADGLYEPWLKLDLRKAGAALKQNAPKVKKTLDEMDAAAMRVAADAWKNELPVPLPGWDETFPADLFFAENHAAEGLAVAEEGNLTVAIDTRLNDELLREGFVRDLIRHCQVLRQQAGLAVEERIRLSVNTDDAMAAAAIAEHREIIADELLAVEMTDELAEPLQEKTQKLGGATVHIALVKA